MGSITVDIQAKVVGYQESLKAMEAAFAKVDPGSSIGKKLSAAIENAKKQVTDLGKNMFPKASSDTQIDAIAERVNRVGAALQNVSNLFQSLNFGDLNLKALSPQISSAVTEMQQLQTAVDSTLNGGIQQAVANSEQLSNVFKNLGVNIKTLTADSGSEILAKGLVDAEQQANKASEAYTKAMTKMQEAQEKLTNIQKNPYSSKGINKEEALGKLMGINDPTRIINEDKIKDIQDQVQSVLSNFKGKGSENSSAAQELVNNFFGNIDPSITVSQFNQKFQDLCHQLQDMGFTSYGIKKILGTTDGTNLFDEILNLDQASQETQTKLQNIMNSFYTTFNFNNKQQKLITDLIDKGEFEKAVEEAKRIIEEGYRKVGEAEKKAAENANKASDKVDAAKTIKTQAETKRDALTGATDTYSKIEADLRSKVASQETRIAQLEEKIRILTGDELSKVKGGVATAGANVGKHIFPTSEAQAYSKELTKINSAQQFVGKLQGVTQRWFSVYAAVRMVSNAIKQIISNTKELDATITEIAIVTNMSQDQLWGQMPQYIEMAKQYGASIAGAYKVSQLYYQQGLGQSDVMALSEQTLKMARISGLDYAQATDYMTNAVRSFKLEMTDAASVVDTYSAVAAASATSVTELATAMSKTASSAQSVGSSLQNTTAMMAVMIEATRESPENIGSAMKSIISRYGELKENKTGIDEEGEEYSLNKVDTALQAVGISIHDAKGEFRDFDDVIFELADHWDEIDKNTQRYIATVMAGNRQQSRFLALVSSGERLKELSETAADSEDASQMQYLKTLDSIEYKSQQMQTSLQSLYASEGVQNLIKDTLDSITNIIDSFNNLSNAFDTPIAAIAKFGVQFANIAHIVTTTFGLIKTGVAAQIDAIRTNGIAKTQQAADQELAIIKNKYTQEEQAAMHTALVKEATLTKGMGPEAADAYATGRLAPLFNMGETSEANTGLWQKIKGQFGKGGRGWALTGLGLSMAGSALSLSAMGMGEETPEARQSKAWQTGLGSLLTGAGMGSMFGPVGIAGGALVGLVSGIFQAQKILDETAEERTERLKKELETAKNEHIAKKNEFKTLKSTIDEYEKLKETHLDSAEAAEKYQETCNKIAEEHPDLISGYDLEGNAILNLAAAYEKLKAAKQEENKSAEKEVDSSIQNAHEATIQAREAAAQAYKDEALNASLVNNTDFDKDEIEWLSTRITQLDNKSSEFSGIELNGKSASQMVDQLVNAAYDDLEAFTKVLYNYEDLLTNEVTRSQLEQHAQFPEIFSYWDFLQNKVTQGQESETLKTDAVVNRRESEERAKVAAGAQTIATGYIQERLLEDQLLNESQYKHLSEFKNASVLGGRFLNEQYKQSTDQSTYFQTSAESDFKKFNDALSEFWSNSSKSAQEQLDNLITSQGNYTQTEMASLLDAEEFDNLSQSLKDTILSYYTETLTSASDVLQLTYTAQGRRDKTGKIGDILRNTEKVTKDLDERLAGDYEWLTASEEERAAAIQTEEARTSFLNKLGENEKQAVSKFYNNILDAINEDTISEDTGEQIATAYVETWKYLTNDDNFKDNKELQQKAQTLLKDSDFTKAEGIQNFVKGLEELGVKIEGVNFDSIVFPPNFSAAVQTFGNTASTQLENFEKDMNSATKGMDFKKASEMASKLGININKFRQEGTKFYLDDYDLLEQYYFEDRANAITDLENEQKRELSSVTKAIQQPSKYKSVLGDLLDEKKYSEDWQKRLIQLFETEDFTKYLTSKDINLNPAVLQKEIEAFMKTEGEHGDEQFLKYLEDHNKELYESYVKASGDVLNSTLAQASLSRGDIEGFIQYAGAKKTAADYLKPGTTFAGLAQQWEMTEQEVTQLYQEQADQYNADLVARIASGDTENLPEQLQQYAKLIYDTFHSTQASVANAMFEAAEGGATSIWADEKNLKVLQQFTDKGWIKTKYGENGEALDVTKGQKYEFDTEKLQSSETEFYEWLNEEELTQKERVEYVKKFLEIKYPEKKKSAAVASLMEKETFSTEELSSYLNDLSEQPENLEEYVRARGLEMNAFGEWYIASEEWFDDLQIKLGVDDGTEAWQREKAKLESARRAFKAKSSSTTFKAVEDLLKDTETISEESREVLAEAIGDSDAAKYFEDNLDGTHKLNVAQLRKDIFDNTTEIGQKVTESQREQLLESFAALGDTAIQASEEVVKLITSGTNKQTDIQKIVNAFNGKYTASQLFTYDDILNASTFNVEYLREYQELQAKDYARAMDVSEEEAFKIVSQSTKDTLQSQINISDFLKAENRGNGSEARQKLVKSIRDLVYSDKDLTEGWEEYKDKLYAEIESGKKSIEDRNIEEEAKEWAEEHNKNLLDAQIQSDIEILEAGGQLAIDKAKELSNKELTSEEIEQYFYSEITRLQDYADQVAELTVGQYVAPGEFKNILRDVGMIDNQGMITNIENAAQAYKAIYDKMRQTGEQTATSLNKVYAQYLTESERGDIDAISVMSDAMGMTYESLGEMLGKYGENLEYWLEDNMDLYEKIGGGKIRITDFTSFADRMGWQPGSEEYTSAFKSYNDGLIELNKKTKESIFDEVSQLESAKIGDQLNLTELYTKLAESTTKVVTGYDTANKKYFTHDVGPLADIQVALSKYGASLVNGILTLNDNANLLGVATTLQAAAEAAGSEMTNELADMVQNILKAYTDAITNGIKGGLNNVQAADLRSKASDLGINNISFVETIDGLKLSQESAIQLYSALKSIDSLQGKLVFDELNASLQESNEHYKSISDIQSRIVSLRNAISAADENTSGARIEQYSQELALAEEILAVRSTSEDASFNFMSNKIPGGQNNPINYYKNWASAIHTFNDAIKNKERGKYVREGKTYESGFVDYQDWYNLVTEMNNIAGISKQTITFGRDIEGNAFELDGSLEAASALIQKGADSLVATSTGDIKVALSGMSIDFESGADAFSGGVTEGIQALAQSQVEMLDGMIQLLETVVAMEKLGDITGDNDTIDIGDLFPDINWESGEKKAISNQQAIDWINNVLLPADKDSDLGKALDNIVINGKTLRKFADDAVNAGLTEAEANNFASVLDSLYKMYTSGEYNLDDLYGSIQQIMGSSHFEGTVQLGDSILHIQNGATVIETTDKKTGKTSFQTPSGKKCDSIDEALARSAVEAYHLDQGKDVTYEDGIATGTITIKDGNKKITINVSSAKDGNVTFVDDDGNKGTTWTDYIKNAFFKDQDVNEVDLNGKAIEIGLQTGAVKLDSYTYKTIGVDLRKQLEEALASGNQVQVDKIIDENAILKQLKGLSMGEIAQQLGLDTSLIDNITKGIEGAIPSIVDGLNGLDDSGPQSVADAIGQIATNAENAATNIGTLIEKLNSMPKISGSDNDEGGSSTSTSQPKTDNIVKASLENIATTLATITNPFTDIQLALNEIKPTPIEGLGNVIDSLKQKVSNVAGALSGIKLEGKTTQGRVNITVQVSRGSVGFAKGNVALAGGTRTLVGELGPELVVSQGRYYIVGQNGAEFVDLEKDAIVFNHQQTARLFANGGIGSRGVPFTNETNAISYAKGTGPAKTIGGNLNKDSILGWNKDWRYTYKLSVSQGSVSGHLMNVPIAEMTLPSAAAKGTGPAKASASAALAALKQLRAQWQALAGLSAQDLAGKGGGGGGGGGGNKNFLKDLERWYDWLQQIAQLEKEITLEQSKRSKYQNDMIAHGKEYFTSQMTSLDKLQQQVATQKSLNESQEAYFEQRRKELNEQSAFSALYGFSETGQLYYKDVYADNKSAFEWLSDLAGRDETTGKANYTAQEQYEKLVAAGFEFAMQYDSSGNEIKKEGDAWYTTAVQAFWDKIDADKEEMQSLHDSVEDGKKEVIERQNDQNEILHDIEDNQIAVEQKVLKAVEESRQRAIDDAKDERDAIEKSANNLIDGLNSQLDKERTLYQNQQSADELASLQRRLGILQRSGGSASEIADLQSQIQEKQYDKYFDIQEQQIQAIQDASDAELERLDNQISLMEETLAYEKEFGLLWNEVDEVLQGTAEDILAFIQGNTEEYWSKSSAELTKCLREDIFEVDRFKEFQTNVQNGLESLINQYGGNTEETTEEQQESNEEEPASDTSSKYTENVAGTWKQGSDGRWWYEHNEADENGKKYTTNNWEKINDKWYYFDEEGWMKTGWLQDGDKWYYLDDTSGEMLTNTTKALTWDGKTQNHTFDENGVWTGASDIQSGSTGAQEWTLKIGDQEYSFDNKKKAQEDYDATVTSYVANLVEKGWTEADAKKSAKENITLNSKSVKKEAENKASGGYVNHGLYELGELGTETVLTASQTKVLRDNILSNRPDSLINLLKSYNEAYHGLSQSTYDSIANVTQNMITIERAEVNLEVEKLADDYDSRRAANTIMDEMLRIASKTKANNSIRR